MKNIIENKYYFFTDGATSNNGKQGARGGWAWVRVHYNDGNVNICESTRGTEENTTNNRCELIAVIDACDYAEKSGYVPAVINSDSAYIINCYKDKWYKKWIENNWYNSKKEPVKNKDLWEKLIRFFDSDRFEFEKVSGHSGVIENEYVDDLAREASRRQDG